MAAARCPICGTVNPDGRRPLAVCSRCGERLGKCRYCRHYDSRLMDCVSPERHEAIRVVDADQVLNCAAFSSSLSARGMSKAALHRRPLTPHRLPRTIALAAALTMAAMFGVIHLYKWYTRPTPIESPLRAKVKAPSVSFRDEGFDVTVNVGNWAEYPAEGVVVAIVGRTMPRLVCTSVDPPDCYLERGPRALRVSIGNLPPGEVQAVTVHFMPERPGDLELRAQVTADNMPPTGRLPITGEVVP